MEEIEEGGYPSTVGVIVPSEVREVGWTVEVGLFRLGGFPRAAGAAISMAKWIGWLAVVRSVTVGDGEIRTR